MNGLEFLDLVIGLIFIYLIFSIAASTIWEIFVNASHLKGNMLRKWIENNFEELNDPTDKEKNKILEHPMIKLFHYPIIRGIIPIIRGIFKRKGSQKSEDSISKPNYISSNIFTDVLVDLVIRQPDDDISSTAKVDIDLFKASLIKTKYLSPGLKSVFLQYIDEASGSLQKVKEKIGIWYDEAQERLIGSYKKNLQMWIFLISAILVGSTNADTFNFVSYLYNNDDAREAIAIKASFFVQDSSIANLITRINQTAIDSASKRDEQAIVNQLKKYASTLDTLNLELKQNSIPIGWNKNELKELKEQKGLKNQKFFWYLKKIAGLLITALAVALGSPFWFDVLSKLSNLRSSGRKPETTGESEELNGKKGKTLKVTSKN